MREDVIGRANVEDTPELDRYYEARPPGELRALDRRQLHRAVAAAADLAAEALELRGDAPAGAAGARSGQPGKGRPPRHRAGESRPQGHLGLRRLALFRPAGDAARRVRRRAQSRVVGAALHHGGQGRLHGGRRPQDGPRRRRLRHHAERHLARSRRRSRRRDDDLAGRPRHAAGQSARRQLLRRASRARAEVELSAQRHRAGLRRAGPAAGRRRGLEQAVLAAAQVRVGPHLRDA